MALYVDFTDGITKTAVVKFTNPKAQPITYEGKFYLADSAALDIPLNTPITKTFTVPALGMLDVIFEVQIPMLTVNQKEFVACIQVSVAGTPVVTFVGIKIVRVTFAAGIVCPDMKLRWDSGEIQNLEPVWALPG